jgi:hypothetical protein
MKIKSLTLFLLILLYTVTMSRFASSQEDKEFNPFIFDRMANPTKLTCQTYRSGNAVREGVSRYLEFEYRGNEQIKTFKVQIFGKDYLVRLKYNSKITPFGYASYYENNAWFYCQNFGKEWNERKVYEEGDEDDLKEAILENMDFDYKKYNYGIRYASRLETIEFFDPATKTVKDIKDFVEPELLKKFEEFKSWIPLAYYESISSILFCDGGNQYLHLLNLATGNVISSISGRIILSSVLSDGIVVRYSGDRLLEVIDCKTGAMIDRLQQNNIVIIDEESWCKEDSIGFIGLSVDRYEKKLSLGIIRNVGIKQLYSITKKDNDTTNVDLMDDFSRFNIFDTKFRTKRTSVRIFNEFLLTNDEFGSLYVYNLAKNGMLERKYESLQISQGRLTEDDLIYLEQFQTNPFTGKKFR